MKGIRLGISILLLAAASVVAVGNLWATKPVPCNKILDYRFPDSCPVQDRNMPVSLPMVQN